MDDAHPAAGAARRGHRRRRATHAHARRRPRQAQAAAAGERGGQPHASSPVLTAQASRSATFPVILEGLGSVAAFYTVTVKAQVGGRIDRVAFKEGQAVKKGDLLVQIDPRPFAIQLESAQAALARDEANLKNSKLNADRYKTLSEQNLIAVQQYTDQQAAVDQLVAQLASDKTQIDAARLNLDYAHVTSPIDGVTGVRLVDPGNFVQPTDATGLVVVTQLDPIAVFFTLPEDDLTPINEAMAAGELGVDAVSRDGDKPLGTGNLTVIDNEINQQTATLKLKAVFDNPKHLLWPNQFVKARLQLATRRGALVVPAAVVQHGPQGTFAYVVKSDSTVEARVIALTAIQGDVAVIASGLQAGEQVVVDGQAQLRPGAKVATKPAGSAHGGRRVGVRVRVADRRSIGIGPAQVKAMSAGVSEPFIRRPVATTLLMVGLLLVGLGAFTQLPVSALPQVDYPTIVVSTYLPGGSADTMASAVTTPLERQFGQMPSLTQMTSVSSFGFSQITLQFDLDRSIDGAQQDVQAAINAASSLLPSQLPTPPTYSKSNPADQPILTLAISSDTLPLDQVDDFADSILAQKISQVTGVGLVTINGGQKPAVRVQVDPTSLAGTGLTLEDVRAALVAANVNQPKGNIDGARQDYALATNDQLFKADGFKSLVIAYANGSPVRLRDVATAVDGVENAQLAGWANDKRAIILNVQRQPGANVIQVADRVKALLPQLQASLPQGIDVKILSDRTETVRASVEDVERTLVITIGLVVAVIFVFLSNIRATLIPSVAVPLSLIGTFGVMYLVGYSLNNLSLMALTIATGFVVDDAIVMIENIARYIEAGDKPFEAALKGAGQIGFTIVSLTVSLVAVLIPLLFMGGLIGRLFREFAVTLAASIGVSALISLTLTPMMCAHLLRPGAEGARAGRSTSGRSAPSRA